VTGASVFAQLVILILFILRPVLWRSRSLDPDPKGSRLRAMVEARAVEIECGRCPRHTDSSSVASTCSRLVCVLCRPVPLPVRPQHLLGSDRCEKKRQHKSARGAQRDCCPCIVEEGREKDPDSGEGKTSLPMHDVGCRRRRRRGDAVVAAARLVAWLWFSSLTKYFLPHPCALVVRGRACVSQELC